MHRLKTLRCFPISKAYNVFYPGRSPNLNILAASPARYGFSEQKVNKESKQPAGTEKSMAPGPAQSYADTRQHFSLLFPAPACL